jgi:hypothetical protein
MFRLSLNLSERICHSDLRTGSCRLEAEESRRDPNIAQVAKIRSTLQLTRSCVSFSDLFLG